MRFLNIYQVSTDSPECMASHKLYFDKADPEFCYPLSYFKERLANDLDAPDTLTLLEAEKAFGTGFFTCQHFGQVGESKESCGKQCEAYKPRNGMSGICVHHGPVYTASPKAITLSKPHAS